MSRMINRLYGRVYGWFDSKDARIVSRPMPAKFSSRAKLLVLNLEDRIVPSQYLVTSNSDAAGSATTVGTLRYAITQAAATAGQDEITFDLTTVGSNTVTIASALPNLGSVAIASPTNGINFDVASGSLAPVITESSGLGTIFNTSNAVPTTPFSFGSATGTTSGSTPISIGGFTISGASSTTANTGGAITMSTQNVTLNGMTITGNTFNYGSSTTTPNLGGGGIFVNGAGTLTVAGGSQITGNIASGTSTFAGLLGVGGGIGSTGAAAINVNTGSSISNNQNLLSGGGISGTAATIIVDDSTLSSNSAGGTAVTTYQSVGGGAIANATGSITVRDLSTLSSNSAVAVGGAIFGTGTINVQGGTLGGSTLSSNFCNIAGGAIAGVSAQQYRSMLRIARSPITVLMSVTASAAARFGSGTPAPPWFPTSHSAARRSRETPPPLAAEFIPRATERSPTQPV